MSLPPARVRSAARPHTAVVAVLCALGVVLAGLVAAVPASAAPAGDRERRGADRPTADFYVNELSQAYQAAKADPTFAPIGFTPQAFWMSDTFMPLDQVRRTARDYARRAEAAGRTPLLAVYAIPARDCGGYSAGGFGPADYRTWTTRMARGLRGTDAVVVLEPDALWLLGQCEQGDRTGLIRHAAKALSRAGARVYIDAGHTGWHTPREMASRLARAGVRFTQGFAVNGASTVRTDLEMAWGEGIAKALAKRGIKGKTFVMDTSRNGGTGSENGNDWCNPMFARLGHQPGWVYQGKLDAYIWLKGPGESDGPCNGGPSAGLWWPEYARLLMGL